MNMRDLIPWTRSQDSFPDLFRDDRTSPFLTLHREMNRLLDEAVRGFASLPSSLSGRRSDFVNPAWPKLEVAETDKQMTVSAEIPGMEEKDVELLFDDGNLIVRGEMKSETEDKERQFSERFYGRFERRIPVGMDIEESKIEASFKNGVLKVTLPKTERAQTKAKRITINTPTKH
jgi:HSP20 family protein